MNEHQKLRRKLWIEVAKSVAGSTNCIDKDVPAYWANAALLAFDNKFSEPIITRKETP